MVQYHLQVDYLTAIRINVDLLDAYYVLGNMMEQQERLDEAIKHYEKVIRLTPNDKLAHFNLDALKAAYPKSDNVLTFF